ncbi:InlB B-repeat-containing protein [Ruminococcoides intestinale]|uniref:InlB B-repeat-containing protein n=1 Tax=Ruminococcoides intestinale TaxID=3133162 RepID=UPI0032D51DD0
MKKRILSILLTLCMTLCFTPISVFAEEVGAGGSAAIKLGADALSVLSKNVNTATAPTVYFGQNHENNPAAWRVIGYDGSGVTSSQGDITLLAAGAMGVIPFVDTILNNEYAPSNLKTAIDALAEKLTTEENAAVKKRALTSGSYDGENTDCVAGGQVDNAVFWPLSTAEAFAVNNDLRALEPAHPNWVTTAWWLRSPGSNKYHLAVVTSDGSVQYSGHTILIFNNHRTVRPAFKLNMNSVLFASAAVGGKPDGGLTPIPEYSGNEWKLTLLDSRRNFAVTEKTVSAAPDDTVTLNYKGATTGKNEYISVILADNNGAQYYGRVAQPTAKSGRVEIKIPSDIAPGDYTMKVFSEQYNGDCKTDLASAFADVTLTVESQPDEQFTLAPGGRYYFDLSAMDIPGTVNSNLPDSTLHYVPFTYVGTVNAYRLTSETATTEEYAQKNKYAHSLFVADYAVTHTVSWDNLNTAGLIFGKDYAAGGVDYTLRAPSVGSSYTGSGDSERGTPKSNEWDKILDKDDGYIKNWREMLSCGQDTTIRISASFRAVRGWKRSARFWTSYNTSYSTFGFRPVLEVLNPDTLGSDGLKVVTLDLGGGTLGNSSEDIQIIVKNGSTFTAPASDGLTRPDGDTDNYFMWLDGNGNSYEPGGSVPADVTELTVQWTAPTYAVTLNTNGGTINNGNVTGYTYGVGATLPAADDMTYTGHTFKGWYDNENLTGSPVTAIGGAETGNKEYWAKWEINQYTVTVKPENGKADITITQDYGTPITAPTLTREGYTFKGWDKEIPKTMPAENITVKAQWEINQYTITFDTNGGSEIAPITQDYGTEITAPDNPTRKGYTFKGWDKEIPKTMPAENMTVKAQWEINQYTITFDTNGGSEIAPITQDYGTEITAPDNPTRKGYTFKGWDKEIPETMPAENITVKAQWEINQYTIAFDTNGGSEIAPITQDYGTEITAPDNPTRKGYTFKGWDKEIPKTMPAENITVKAQWEINQYTITFDTNGGSDIAPITQDYGAEITAPDNPTRKGYTFKGWDKEIPETMPAENITVKAQWEINQYTITFDTNGGSEIAPITQDYGTEITAPDKPTRKGYTFKGWDKEIPETMPAENITVKAQWEINQYTITFDTNGGSEIAPITQDYGTEITAPDNPTRKGYTFKGWDKEIPKTMPAENITVKAQWEINQYTIAFDTNGGSEIAPITQDYGTQITAPDKPTRKGYSFKGWDKEIPETMPAENITITARWKDTEKPTGEIIIGTNKWNEFLNELTFGIFFKDTQEVTINAVDNSGVVFVSYLVTDKELSEAELNSLVFRAYEEPFCIDPNGEYIIYVMLVDENINITYLRSDRITLDNIQPVISGIENGKTYCEVQTVTVDEKYVDTVTVNGTAVTLDADGGFVLPPTNGEQKIVVTDKAGNNAEMTVTVNNGHTFGEWVSDNDGKHTRKCIVDGCDAFETENCSGGNATCTEKAVCDVCGKPYGEFDGTNHEGGVQEWTTRTAFVHEQKWNCCGAVIVASEAHKWKDGVCRECGYVCLHNDADKDHICDYCEKAISAHEDVPTEEIKKADTVTAKLPDDSKSPQTGDNSNLILWIALLIISGGVMKGVTAFGKSKKHSAKIKDK